MPPCPTWICRALVGALLGFAPIMAAADAARAHTARMDGEPIPDWVRKACCGRSEAHRPTPSQVHRVDGAYRIDDYPNRIYDAQVPPSQDGEY